MRYSGQARVLVAIDCIIFGFDGENLKLLLMKRGIEPEKKKWSLLGGFIQPKESLDEAANRILKKLTGLENVYMEQLYAFGAAFRDPVERTVSVAYTALIDIHKYERQLIDNYHAEWFLVNHLPSLIFDHNEMVEVAKQRLKYKASSHPILFELLPEKFTIPKLQNLFEGVFETSLDNRNFSRKILSTGLLIKQAEKDKEKSKKGAFFYKLNKEKYQENFQAFLNFLPRSENLNATVELPKL